jgi:hypothetical protein
MDMDLGWSSEKKSEKTTEVRLDEPCRSGLYGGCPLTVVFDVSLRILAIGLPTTDAYGRSET